MPDTLDDPRQFLDPRRTTWHITFGTHGARLHGGDALTVDREHNRRGEAFIARNPDREREEAARLRGTMVRLTDEQRAFIERTIPRLCERGGRMLRTCAAPPPPEDDHVHVLLDADPHRHGKDIRKWLKRWLSEPLTVEFGPPAAGEGWAEGGSTKPVKEERYLNNAYAYVARQRSTPPA